ncbi:MAG: hypothetical protein GY835_10800 [bacterium]|nr:hypothetical protein [bacterium]
MHTQIGFVIVILVTGGFCATTLFAGVIHDAAVRGDRWINENGTVRQP